MKSNSLKEILPMAAKGLFDCSNFLLVTDKGIFQCGTDKQIENALIEAASKDSDLIDILNESTKEAELARMNLRNEKGL